MTTEPSFFEQFLMAFLSAGAILTALAGVILGYRGQNTDLQLPKVIARPTPSPIAAAPIIERKKAA